jgi:WD40 repeat protein
MSPESIEAVLGIGAPPPPPPPPPAAEKPAAKPPARPFTPAPAPAPSAGGDDGQMMSSSGLFEIDVLMAEAKVDDKKKPGAYSSPTPASSPPPAKPKVAVSMSDPDEATKDAKLTAIGHSGVPANDGADMSSSGLFEVGTLLAEINAEKAKDKKKAEEAEKGKGPGSGAGGKGPGAGGKGRPDDSGSNPKAGKPDKPKVAFEGEKPSSVLKKFTDDDSKKVAALGKTAAGVRVDLGAGDFGAGAQLSGGSGRTRTAEISGNDVQAALAARGRMSLTEDAPTESVKALMSAASARSDAVAAEAAAADITEIPKNVKYALIGTAAFLVVSLTVYFGFIRDPNGGGGGIIYEPTDTKSDGPEPTEKWSHPGPNTPAAETNDVSSGFIREFKGHEGPVYCVAYDPNGKYGLTAGHDRTLRLWDLEKGTMARRFDDPATASGETAAAAHSGPVEACAFNNDASVVASGGKDGVVKVWDTETGALKFSLAAHSGPVKAVAFSRDGQWLATAGSDKSIRIWPTATPSRSPRISIPNPNGPPGQAAHKAQVFSLAFTGDRLISGSFSQGEGDKSIRIWNPSTGAEDLAVDAFPPVMRLSPSYDGSRVAACGGDKLIYIVDTKTGTPRAKIGGHSDVVTCCSMSLSGRRIVSGGRGDDASVRYWNRFTGQELAKFPNAHVGTVRDVAISPLGKRCLSVGQDGVVKLWALPGE